MLAPTKHKNAVAAEHDTACELPEGWAWATLGNITSPRGERGSPADLPSKPFIGLKHVEAHTMRLLSIGSTSLVKSSGAVFGPGDVLYGRLRPYLNKVYSPDFAGLASGEFIVLPRQAHLNSGFLKYFLNRNEFAAFATRLNAGDRPRVHFDQLAHHPFPLPPLAEQCRIVEEIEKQLTRSDASVASLKRAQANLKRYRASVLKAACEGTLVPTEAELAKAEGSDYEPADQLLERILTERRARWAAQNKRRGKYKEPVAPDTSDLLGQPEGWTWATLDQLAAIGTGSTPLTSRTEFYQDGSIPWVTSSALNDPVVSTPSSYVTQEAVKVYRLSLYPIHTLLVAMYGEGKTRGKCSELMFPSTINQAIAALTMEGSADDCRTYIKVFLHSNYEATRRLSSGGVQPNLNLGLIKRLAMPLPPLTEQTRIVAEVERQLSVIQQAEATVEANLTRAERLRQSILKQAFSGMLVPQDPNDEPASELLKRIRAEREAAQAASKPRSRAKRRTVRSNSEKQSVLGI